MKRFVIYLIYFVVALIVANILGRMYVYTLSDIHQMTLIMFGLMVLIQKGVKDE